MLINIEMCLNSDDLKIFKIHLNQEKHTKQTGANCLCFTNNQTKEEHHG